MLWQCWHSGHLRNFVWLLFELGVKQQLQEKNGILEKRSFLWDFVLFKVLWSLLPPLLVNLAARWKQWWSKALNCNFVSWSAWYWQDMILKSAGGMWEVQVDGLVRSASWFLSRFPKKSKPTVYFLLNQLSFIPKSWGKAVLSFRNWRLATTKVGWKLLQVLVVRLPELP